MADDDQAQEGQLKGCFEKQLGNSQPGCIGHPGLDNWARKETDRTAC